jgi:hypothetical protein
MAFIGPKIWIGEMKSAKGKHLKSVQAGFLAQFSKGAFQLRLPGFDFAAGTAPFPEIVRWVKAPSQIRDATLDSHDGDGLLHVGGFV